MLFVDFEKAFDTLEWSFIRKAFEHYNFGPSLIRWIKVFYNDIESCILNNGWSSGFCSLSRGVRQGCPLSPYIIIVCAEILVEAIRKDITIKGIKVDGTECKICQYADDTTLFLDGSEASLQASLNALERFSNLSVLKMNSKKNPEALWLEA